MTFEIDNRVILITGGTGSFGQKLAETLLTRHKPRKVIIFSRDEMKQYEMRQKEIFQNDSRIRFFIGDVRDMDRLEMAFREVDYVVHAAAMKHITVAEYNPFECIQTNVIGAQNVVKAAMNTGVTHVIALSTDKAANPINLYGASKLASDKIFVAAKWMVGTSNRPMFAVVRYGNVIGSRGSVVPFFEKLMADGEKSLPITDARMTRFWITLQQGVDFVLTCLPMVQGGEIFVPKIPSMTVMDLAKTVAPHLDTHVVGIRPGEKLHEAMITEDESRSALELPDRYVIRPLLYGEQRHYHADEKTLPEGFLYSSDNNPWWLDADGMRQLLNDQDIGTTSAAAQ
jgi:UDP-N-acetylglucosamine 4,6-dehydratase/5-epimerase